jgi:PIN domain nuclease of toxin-antitoxin system
LILLDTHVWLWWVSNSSELPQQTLETIRARYDGGICVSVISCWEVAQKVSIGKLELYCPVDEWITSALDPQGVECVSLGREIALLSTQLPGTFHKDPADRIIAATSIYFDLPLLTLDEKILTYPHVKTL